MNLNHSHITSFRRLRPRPHTRPISHLFGNPNTSYKQQTTTPAIMAMRVESKTAIVTGAGSGINLCFAKLLLSKGCNVVFADLALRPEAEAVVAQYPLTSPQGTAKAVFQKTDVTDWAQLDKMFEVAIEHFGGADIVCPGAGVFEPVSKVTVLYPKW